MHFLSCEDTALFEEYSRWFLGTKTKVIVLPIDELAWKSQVQVNELASQLLTLEFKGLIKSLPGKKYKLVS